MTRLIALLALLVLTTGAEPARTSVQPAAPAVTTESSALVTLSDSAKATWDGIKVLFL